MKKLLLIACAMVAMTANAQKLATVSNDAIKKVEHAPIATAKLKTPENLQIKDFAAQRAIIAKAPAQGDIYGTYIEDSYTWIDEENGLHENSTATLAAYEYTDEETNETFELVSVSMGEGYCNVIGEYNAEEGRLSIPVAQLCYNHETYGRFVFYGIDMEDNIIQGEEEALTYILDEESGIFMCEQAGYALWMYDYVDAEGNEGAWWIVKYDTGLMPQNANSTYYKSEDSGWNPYDQPVAVVDNEVSVDIYGVCGFGMMSVEVNEDLTVTIPCHQPLYWAGSQYGGTFDYIACPVQDGKISRDYSVDSVTGFISGNKLYFVDPETEQYHYFSIAAPADEEGRAYATGWYTALVVELLNENTFLAGIDTPTLEERIKNTKTYNLMGQQVNRDSFKGLMIRDGKKIVKK